MRPLYNERQKLLQATIKQFAQNELLPKAQFVDENEQFPREQIVGLANIGITGLTLDEKYGGNGGEYKDMMVVLEEVAAACGSTSTVLLTHVSLGSQTINQFGSKAQKQHWIPSLSSAKNISAFALTEPNTGSDALELQTSITEDNGNYILNGTKLFCTNGAEADIFVIFANHDKSLGHRGISTVVVERNTNGFAISPQRGKMGMRGCATAELIFEDCVIPKANLLGNLGDGYLIALKILDSSRIMIAAQCLGMARAALNTSVEYSKNRKAFGEPISNKQIIQFMLADMATELDAARLLTFRAASLYDSNLPHSKEAAMAKLYASEMAGRVAHKALQIHGGVGYFRPNVVERIYRDQRVTEIYEGTSEIQRLVISRSILNSVEL